MTVLYRTCLAFCLLVCFATQSHAQPLELSYAGSFGGDGNQIITFVAIAEGGSTFLVGSTAGATDLDIGPGSFPCAPSGSVAPFLVKLGPDGEFQWGHCLTPSEGSFSDGRLLMLSDGHLLHVFQFSGTVDMDQAGGGQWSTSAGGHDIGLRKLTQSGEVVWAKRLGGLGNEFPHGLCETPDGGIVIVGAFNDETVLDPNGVEGYHDAGGFNDLHLNMFMVKLDDQGDYLWSGSAGGDQHDRFLTVNPLPNGGLLVSGLVEGAPADVDPGPGVHIIDPGLGRSGVLLEFTSQGDLVGVREMASFDFMSLTGVRVNSAGEIFVSGIFDQDAVFLPDGVTLNIIGGGAYSLFVAKYGVDGSMLWVKTLQNGGWMYGQWADITLDHNEDIIIHGRYFANFDADPGPGITNIGFVPGHNHAFLINLDTHGDYRWSTYTSATVSNIIRGMAVKDSAVVLVGTFQGVMDADLGPGVTELVSTGGLDGFVAMYGLSGCAGLIYQVTDFQPVLCEQQGSITGEIVGGVPPYDHVWDLDPPQPGLSVVLSAPGTATIHIEDAIGCTTSRTLIVPGTVFQAHDLTPAILSSTLRAGMTTQIWIDAINLGCTPVDAELKLVLPSLVSFSGAVPPPSTIDGDTLFWSLPDLEAVPIPMTITIDVLVEGTAMAGEQICFKASMDPVEDDAVPGNNVQNLCGVVLNSYDPNDKQVVPSGMCDEGWVPMDQTLRYIARFQNTGNAPAIDIVVVDTLSPSLDPASLRIISYSHPMVAEWASSHVLRFVFNDIYLADSLSNEPESHGHVVFELDPIPDLLDGQAVHNHVAIYFDLNEPIITNEVRNTFVLEVPSTCGEVGMDPRTRDRSMVIWPNPCAVDCSISMADGSVPHQVEVFDATGRYVATYRSSGAMLVIPANALASGLYCARVSSGRSYSSALFVIE